MKRIIPYGKFKVLFPPRLECLGPQSKSLFKSPPDSLQNGKTPWYSQRTLIQIIKGFEKLDF